MKCNIFVEWKRAEMKMVRTFPPSMNTVTLVWFRLDWFLCANRRRSLSRSSVFCMLIFLEIFLFLNRKWLRPQWHDGGGCSCSLDGRVWVGEEPGARASRDVVGQLQSDSGSSHGRFCERPPLTAHLHHLKQVRRRATPTSCCTRARRAFYFIKVI